MQSTRQRPGQAESSAPSQTSLGWFSVPSPQRGSGWQVQSARQRPGHAALAAPSHCSVAWFTRLSPQRGDGATTRCSSGPWAVPFSREA